MIENKELAQKQQEKLERRKRNLEIQRNNNPLNVNILNIWKKNPKKIMWMFISALLYNLALTVFLKKAATIATGTSSFAQLITFLGPSSFETFYGFFYVLVNLPLMFIFWKANPRLFMVLTFWWMFFQCSIQCIFIDYTGNGNPITDFLNTYISVYRPETPSGNYTFNGEVIKIKYWSVYTNSKGGYYDGQNWPILIYAFLGGIFEASSSVLAWRARGSIGGTSIISNYFALKKKKAVGNVLFFVALVFSAFSIIVLGSLEAAGKVKGRSWDATSFLTRLCGTFIFLIISTFIVNKFFPKYKKVKIEIYTQKAEWIAEHFKKIGYAHAFNIYKGYAGFSHAEFAKVETIALYLEKDIILERVKEIDKNAWIATSNIQEINGHFDTSFID
ncbi:uncharacterized membrane-anchored protein YitT (DUF2179 family) [Metamycoplasma subdolum]|uniref:Uncharacterized membrane-anchored protein YitT (DUF2179 family) n=1 Tax=Metamycoplasma subdolum TaxID=92407 RepID=A0A3L9ZZ02_9BACT|nr:DUF2179 domain-containing protein [Metamycoplasma subdolum]RMA77597.1 uncharacterized membrane-anchored protein YitT (DUF2179 family) [Metamycoplasma subdolum]WPB50391.1 YitT family protein [Metamycoplasma subdolum]